MIDPASTFVDAEVEVAADTTLLQTVVDTTASLALRNLLMLIGGIVMLFVTLRLAGII